MTVDQNEVRIRQLETRLVIVEDRVIGRNGLVSASLCVERHEGVEGRMESVERSIRSVNARLWMILIGVTATLASVVATLLMR